MKYFIFVPLILLFSCSQSNEGNSIKKDNPSAKTNTISDSSKHALNNNACIKEDEFLDTLENQCDFLIDWKYLSLITVYTNNFNDSIVMKNDSINEDYLMGQIVETRKDFFNVKIKTASDKDYTIGLIRKSEPIGVFLNNYSNDTIWVRRGVDKESEIELLISKYDPSFFKIESAINESILISKDGTTLGWIDNEHICASPYTTCN